jgi:hypothetical protein
MRVAIRLHGKCMLGCRRYANVLWVGSIRTRIGEVGLYGCGECLTFLESVVEDEVAAEDQAALIAR